MANNTPKKIKLRSAISDLFIEALSAGTITPGDFLEVTSSDTLQRQSTQYAKGPKIVALENTLEGNDIDDDYASGDSVRAVQVISGDEIYAFVPAGATAIAIGDELVFNGDGTVIKGDAVVTSGTYSAETVNKVATVAYAMEAVDNSDGASKARIKIRMA